MNEIQYRIYYKYNMYNIYTWDGVSLTQTVYQYETLTEALNQIERLGGSDYFYGIRVL